MHLSLQWGRTALMIAYDLGHIGCSKMLVDKGALLTTEALLTVCSLFLLLKYS